MAISLIIVGSIGGILGAFFGNELAKRGITADNALLKHQTTARLIFLALAGLLTLLVAIEHWHLYYQFPNILPIMLVLWIQANYDKFIFAISGFIFGFLLFLEISGWSSPPRRRQLLLGLSLISCGLAVLFYLFSPIVGQIQPLRLSDGVVLQTTPVTCAPATIATLARFSGKYPEIGERDVAFLTQTNRLGTSTLQEITALKKLGFQPDYRYQLTLDELVRRKQMALLHVRQSWEKDTFPHAVALLGFEENPPTFILGNPLFGIEERPLEKMNNYWFGEAIFIQN